MSPHDSFPIERFAGAEKSALDITSVTDDSAPVQLTTTQVIAALCTLGRQIGTAQEHFDRIPASTRPYDSLNEIIRSCEDAIKCARRLFANDKGRRGAQ